MGLGWRIGECGRQVRTLSQTHRLTTCGWGEHACPRQVRSYRASYGAGVGWQIGDEIECGRQVRTLSRTHRWSCTCYPPFSGGRSSGCGENACTHHEASVGSKRAVEDTHRHTDGPLYNYSSAVHFSVSSTVACHARRAKREQRSRYWGGRYRNDVIGHV